MYRGVVGVRCKTRIKAGLLDAIGGAAALAHRRMLFAKTADAIVEADTRDTGRHHLRTGRRRGRVDRHAAHVHLAAGVVDAADHALRDIERLLRHEHQPRDITAADNIADDANFIRWQRCAVTRLQSRRCFRARLHAQQARRSEGDGRAGARTEHVGKGKAGLPDRRNIRRGKARGGLEQIRPGHGRCGQLQNRIARHDDFLAVQGDCSTGKARMRRVANRTGGIERGILDKAGDIKARRHRRHRCDHRRCKGSRLRQSRFHAACDSERYPGHNHHSQLAHKRETGPMHNTLQAHTKYRFATGPFARCVRFVGESLGRRVGPVCAGLVGLV